jgi:hypothetical protein
MTNNEQLKVDGFDDACIGTDYRDLRLVYSIERIIQILITRDGMDMDEAIEYFDHNIGCAFVGEMTPMYVWTEDKVDL